MTKRERRSQRRVWAEARPTREAWILERLADIQDAGYARNVDPSTLYVSVGWAGGVPYPATTLGTTQRGGSDESTSHVFVSPMITDPEAVLSVLMHELAHVIASPQAGHGPGYAVACRMLGLVSSPSDPPDCWDRALPGPDLSGCLRELVAASPAYPHSMVLPGKLDAPEGTGGGCGTGALGEALIPAQCPACAYEARIPFPSAARGLPRCPCGREMEEPA